MSNDDERKLQEKKIVSVQVQAKPAFREYEPIHPAQLPEELKKAVMEAVDLLPQVPGFTKSARLQSAWTYLVHVQASARQYGRRGVCDQLLYIACNLTYWKHPRAKVLKAVFEKYQADISLLA